MRNTNDCTGLPAMHQINTAPISSSITSQFRVFALAALRLFNYDVKFWIKKNYRIIHQYFKWIIVWADRPRLIKTEPPEPVSIKKEGENFTVSVKFEGYPQPNVSARLFSLENKTCTKVIYYLHRNRALAFNNLNIKCFAIHNPTPLWCRVDRR